MPAGQTPHTTIVYAHNDLVDKVQPGDRINITGKIPKCLLPKLQLWSSSLANHIGSNVLQHDK